MTTPMEIRGMLVSQMKDFHRLICRTTGFVVPVEQWAQLIDRILELHKIEIREAMPITTPGKNFYDKVLDLELEEMKKQCATSEEERFAPLASEIAEMKKRIEKLESVNTRIAGQIVDGPTDGIIAAAAAMHPGHPLANAGVKLEILDEGNHVLTESLRHKRAPQFPVILPDSYKKALGDINKLLDYFCGTNANVVVGGISAVHQIRNITATMLAGLSFPPAPKKPTDAELQLYTATVEGQQFPLVLPDSYKSWLKAIDKELEYHMNMCEEKSNDPAYIRIPNIRNMRNAIVTMLKGQPFLTAPKEAEQKP